MLSRKIVKGFWILPSPRQDLKLNHRNLSHVLGIANSSLSTKLCVMWREGGDEKLDVPCGKSLGRCAFSTGRFLTYCNILSVQSNSSTTVQQHHILQPSKRPFSWINISLKQFEQEPNITSLLKGGFIALFLSDYVSFNKVYLVNRLQCALKLETSHQSFEHTYDACMWSRITCRNEFSTRKIHANIPSSLKVGHFGTQEEIVLKIFPELHC